MVTQTQQVVRARQQFAAEPRIATRQRKRRQSAFERGQIQQEMFHLPHYDPTPDRFPRRRIPGDYSPPTTCEVIVRVIDVGTTLMRASDALASASAALRKLAPATSSCSSIASSCGELPLKPCERR